METKPSKFLATITVLAGGLLFLAGCAALLGFLGLPVFIGGDLLSSQIGIMAAIFLGLGCGTLAIVHGFGSLLHWTSAKFRLPPSYFFWIVFGLVLGLGNVLLNNKTALEYIFPFVFLLGAALPTLAVLAQGNRKLGGAATWRQVALMFVAGSTLSIFSAIVLESILPSLAYLLLAPFGALAEGFSTLSFGAPGFIERIFFSPMIVVFLIFTAIQAPIPEEFAKALGPALMGKRIQNERQAFLIGLAAGAGFAILENMLYEGIYAQWNGWSWGGITLLRGFGSILHPLCTGIIALAFFRARNNGKGWLATVGPAYALSVGLHTLWNGGFESLTYLTGLDYFMGEGPSFSLYGASVQGILILFLFGLSLGLWLYFNRILNRLGQGLEIELAPILISRRALTGIALAALAVLVPIGAMLGPAWTDIHAAALGGVPTGIPTSTPTPTSTQKPTPTPPPTKTPTALFLDSSQNYLATATKLPQHPALLSDKFDQETNGWATGVFEDARATGRRKIDGGKYLWSFSSSNGVFEYLTLGGHELPAKFYLAVDVQRKGSSTASPCLVFRTDQGRGSYYMFSINDASQMFSVYAYSASAWKTILPATNSTAILTGQVNRLAVLADGSRYILFINGQYAGVFLNGDLKTGGAGLGVSLEAGQSADIEFDNFDLDY